MNRKIIKIRNIYVITICILIVIVISISQSKLAYAQPTVTLDPSTPVSAWPGTGSGNVTSSSFTPPGGSIILALAEADSSTSVAWTSAITDNLSTHLSWNRVLLQDATDNVSTVVAYWAYVGSSSPGAMTITLTTNGGTAGAIWLTPLVIDGADTSDPIGSVISGSLPPSDSSLSETITPKALGSALIGAAIQPYGGSFTAGTGNYIEALAPNPHLAAFYIGSSGGFADTTSNLPETFSINSSATNAYYWAYLGIEVVPTPSAPSGGSSGSNTALSTANNASNEVNKMTSPVTGYGEPPNFPLLLTSLVVGGSLSFLLGCGLLIYGRRR
ncbi:MAG: hypothetical protein ACYCPS_03835 [Candidatus Saccharimonadales bacterium]